jgi:hypothetical protein
MINQPVELSIDEAIYFASTKTRAMGSGLECGLVHGGQTLLRIEERSRSPRVSRFRSKPPRLLDRSLGLVSGGPPFFSVWNFRFVTHIDVRRVAVEENFLSVT